MSIKGRSLDDAVRQFKELVDGLLNSTLTGARIQPQYITPKKAASPLVAITLRSSGGVPGARLFSRTHKAKFVLIVGQHLTSDVTKAGKHILRTRRYRYGLALEGDDDSLIRWEYDRDRPAPGDLRCRHHFQGTPEVVIKDVRLPLNAFHLPTGYVALEEVIRFCIVDLGVKPKSKDWDDILSDSYRKFRQNLRCPQYATCAQVADDRTA